jgi:ADP-ribose pyrophosphatase YjhB (NUDIX family)
MDIFGLLDELRTIARNGLTFSTNPYDTERYQHLLDLTSQTYSETLGIPSGEVRDRFMAELGYVTPKVGADAAIFDDNERVLLVKRTDDGRYCLPCGWMNPNESTAESAVREVYEETGFTVHVARLVDVFTRKPSAELGPHTTVAVVYLCEVTGGEARESHETTDIGYWRIEDVPAWHGLHHQYALAAREVWRARQAEPSAS